MVLACKGRLLVAIYLGLSSEEEPESRQRHCHFPNGKQVVVAARAHG